MIGAENFFADFQCGFFHADVFLLR
jgi:hypothetical protein